MLQGWGLEGWGLGLADRGAPENKNRKSDTIERTRAKIRTNQGDSLLVTPSHGLPFRLMQNHSEVRFGSYGLGVQHLEQRVQFLDENLCVVLP